MCALLARARVARGCVTPGDDRLETRAYAVKRYLFRLGHAARSARYATSIAQFVVGLAPVMGWGPVPRGGAERARLVGAHRRSVQRWLDDLEVAGLVVHEPERDGDGRWWRTQIMLLAAPASSDDERVAVEVELAHRQPRRLLALLAGYEQAIASGATSGGLIYVSDRHDVLDAAGRAAKRAALPDGRFRTRTLEEIRTDARGLAQSGHESPGLPALSMSTRSV